MHKIMLQESHMPEKNPRQKSWHMRDRDEMGSQYQSTGSLKVTQRDDQYKEDQNDWRGYHKVNRVFLMKYLTDVQYIISVAQRTELQ